MDDDEARALIIKQSRRSILDALKQVYPARFSFYSLRVVCAEIEERHLKADVAYLIDKGYLVWHEPTPNMAWDRREYRLSAEGVEIADRIEVDPALTP